MLKKVLLFIFAFFVTSSGLHHFDFNLNFLPKASAQAKKHRHRKFLNLTIGITHDEKLPKLSSTPKFKGDFRKVTQASYASEIKVLRFTPKKVGVATLTVHDKLGNIVAEYRIDVKKSNLTKVVREVRALLGEIEGINIKIVNNKVIVDGQILLPSDMTRIYNVLKQFEGQASSLVTLSPIAQKKIAQFIEKDVNNPEITVRAINGTFILEGLASSPDERARAYAIAQTYVPDVVVETAETDGVVRKIKKSPVVNLIDIKQAGPRPPGKIIQLVIHYVELQKDYTKGFRFQWTPDLSDGSQLSFQSSNRGPGGVISTLTGTISNLLPKLNWAKEHGHARVLQSSSLIVEDGKKGDLRSQTKVPYQIVAKDGQLSTNFANVGLQTSITPTIIGPRSDSISLNLEFALASLISYTPQGPLTSNNTIKTIIVVRSGQSAAIGGLISNSSGTNYNKLPKNASSNPLVSLYASKDFRRNQSQFVVFVTPLIKSSASSGAEQIKRKFRLRN